MARHLPPEEVWPPESLVQEESLPHLAPRSLHGAAARRLLAERPTPEELRPLLEAWLAARPEPPPEPEAPAPPPPRRSAARESRRARKRHEEEEAALRRQVQEGRREISRLEGELSRAREEKRLLEEERSRLQDSLGQAERRAADLKQQLQASKAPSRREEKLQGRLEALERTLHVLQEKFRMIEEERDDLREVLADRERFDEAPEEEIPSFRDRPLLAEEQELAQRLAARRESGRPPLRILVIGGGEPQYRHRERFEEYASILGFQGEWRLADYSSWHQAMDALARDMRERFDALVILHWNRTTFTRNARRICNEAGQKPCITCHYEGFTSLRQTLQECLRQLLAREGPATAAG